MRSIKPVFSKSPLLLTILFSLVWLVLLFTVARLLSVLLGKPFGEAPGQMISHLILAVCVFLVLWKQGMLKDAGITIPGKKRVWLIAILGTLFFTGASLYSLCGKMMFDFSRLLNIRFSGEIVLDQVAVCLDEEMFFRGLMLCLLVRSRILPRMKKLGNLVLLSVIFALMHLPQFFAAANDYKTGLIFFLEIVIISFWWSSLVLASGSIWPAFLAHFVVNSAVALQCATENFQAGSTGWLKLLLFAVPLGMIAYWLLSGFPATKTSKE